MPHAAALHQQQATLAQGFTPSPGHLKKYDILPVSVGTDPHLALETRRGTGYYKVPSLKGVWYRGPFEHNGSVLTLEDWFDPQRLRDDYVPDELATQAVQELLARRFWERNKIEAKKRRGDMTDKQVEEYVDKVIHEFRAENRGR